MNESQIIAWLKTYVYAAPEVQLEMIREMAQRFDGLHKRIAKLSDENAELLNQSSELTEWGRHAFEFISFRSDGWLVKDSPNIVRVTE